MKKRGKRKAKNRKLESGGAVGNLSEAAVTAWEETASGQGYRGGLPAIDLKKNVGCG